MLAAPLGYSLANFPIRAPKSVLDHADVIPIQRVAAAKGAVSAPDASVVSSTIPDLPKTYVDKITAATDSASRQTVLNELLDYLDTKGVVDDRQHTTIVYDDQRHATSNAVTEMTGTGDNDPVRITVYSNAFADGPAVLYSTLRHELIHAGQRMSAPDESRTESTDDYIHDDFMGDAPDSGTAYNKRELELPMQEIEAYTWELLNADKTGVNANQSYMNSTVSDLVGYAGTLIETVEDDNTLPDNAFFYWYNYLGKAVGLLNHAASKYPNYKDIRKMAKNLQDAIDGRGPVPQKQQNKKRKKN